MLEFMSDATRIPILFDGDTGFGNFNNMRRLVVKLEQRRIAGVCIEDKLFPKSNSFLRGEAQPLADIDEFCGKIIAGWGLAEALRRADAYRTAGADGILIHSARRTPDEDPGLQTGVGRSLPGGDRTDQVLRDADRGVPRLWHLPGDLGQSPAALLAQGYAGDRRHLLP